MKTQEEKDLKMVQQDGLALQYVNDQTTEICHAAVQKNGYALQFVKTQTPELCLAAVKQAGLALQYVMDQTDEICLAAVKEYGYALRFVKNQTTEICLAAVQQNSYALYYVKDQTPELCLAAVQKNGYALQYVKDQTFKIVMVAMRKGDVSKYIKIEQLQHEHSELTYTENAKYQLQDILNLEYSKDSADMSQVNHYLQPFIKKDDKEITLLSHVCTGVVRNQIIINLLIEDNELDNDDYINIIKNALIWKSIWKYMLDINKEKDVADVVINIFILSNDHETIDQICTSVKEREYVDINNSNTTTKRIDIMDLLIFRNEI